MRYSQIILTVAWVTFAVTQGSACIWDSDTLAAERARFPQVAELITGSFARHSREFHEWRKARSEAMIKNKAAVAETYDDLAVSQHKLGDHKAAIATMQQKEKLFPGKYETFSNLGTFYIYTGELNQALLFIGKALVIDPNAHFGREKYQLWLVEWLQEKAQVKEEDRGGLLIGDGHATWIRGIHRAARNGPQKGGKDTGHADDTTPASYGYSGTHWHDVVCRF